MGIGRVKFKFLNLTRVKNQENSDNKLRYNKLATSKDCFMCFQNREF